MATDQTAHLHAATLRRATASRARARAALRRLDKQGATINYVSVAETAGRLTLAAHRDPELRAEIDRLRKPRTGHSAATTHSGTDVSGSRDELDAALRGEVKELRRKKQALQSRLATASAKHAAKITKPVPDTQ